MVRWSSPPCGYGRRNIERIYRHTRSSPPRWKQAVAPIPGVTQARSENGRGWRAGGRGEGIERTSPTCVRMALTAVVGDGWLPVAATQSTVDAADKKVEKFTALVVPLSEPRTVVVGIAGVSPLTSPQFRLVNASVGKVFGHCTQVGSGCGGVG